MSVDQLQENSVLREHAKAVQCKCFFQRCLCWYLSDVLASLHLRFTKELNLVSFIRVYDMPMAL